MSAAFKQAAAQAALALVEPGMRLGLGTGSTAAAFVRLLGAKGHDGVCVATSLATAVLAREVGLKVTSPDAVEALDLAVDGADEIGPGLALIKGGGAALLREKIVAAAARRFVVIADASKVVAQLGRFPLPVEIAPFGWRWTAARIAERTGAAPRLRLGEGGAPLVTDNGGWLLDAPMGAIPAPEALAAVIEAIPGVAGHGLFVGLAERAIVADAGGVRELLAA